MLMPLTYNLKHTTYNLELKTNRKKYEATGIFSRNGRNSKQT